jgi:hypothetical protein
LGKRCGAWNQRFLTGQGRIGQALHEYAVYDRSTAMDYAMPRADMVPNFEIALEEVRYKTNPIRREGHRRVRHHRGSAGRHQCDH